MRTIAIALMLVTSLAAVTDQATAQSRTEKFPYEATIADEEVYARSGPSNKPYYPTSRLRKGDRVTVIRHDHGGWFMIEPPPGSFAWVRQEFVDRHGDRGVIIGDSQIVAWVGTSFGDDHYVEQRRLQPGEAVEILGEKTLRDGDERGEVAYFRIRSPKGHFRWIPGSKVVTSEQQMAAANARGRGSDPFASDKATNDSTPRSSASRVDPASLEPSSDNALAASEKSVPTPQEHARRPAPTPKDIDDEAETPKSSPPVKKESATPSAFVAMDASGQQRLTAIDEQMQAMLQRNTRDWNFAAIESELQALQAQESTANGAARRLASLEKYKRIKADYDDFASIMEKTNRRDAELAAVQRGGQSISPNRPQATPRAATPSPSNGRATSPRSPSAPSATKSPTTSRLKGAGIIQRSGSNRPGVPKYVLLHPNGQRLAYLQSDEVDLAKYVGEAMGLEGERYYRPDLKSDFLVVKSLQPVKLKP